MLGRVLCWKNQIRDVLRSNAKCWRSVNHRIWLFPRPCLVHIHCEHKPASWIRRRRTKRWIEMIRSVSYSAVVEPGKSKRSFVTTSQLRFWVGWRKALLGSLTNIWCCSFICNKTWDDFNWLWSWNFNSWTQKMECCERTWLINRWPFLWIQLAFTVSAGILFHLGIIKEPWAFTLKQTNNQPRFTILFWQVNCCIVSEKKLRFRESSSRSPQRNPRHSPLNRWDQHFMPTPERNNDVSTFVERKQQWWPEF